MPYKLSSSEEVDVDGLVLYEELQPLQFDLRHSISKKKLLLGALCILGVDVSTLICSNDAFFISLQSDADTSHGLMSDVLESITGSYLMSELHWINSSLLGFIDNLLEYFTTRLFVSDIRIRKIWFRAAVEANKRNHEGDNDEALTRTGKRILEKYKDDLLLWVAYASILFDSDQLQESERVWMAVMQTLSNRPHSSVSISLISIVFEMLESSVPTMSHVYLLAFAATGNGDHLHEFRSKFKNKECTSPSISAAIIQMCRNFYQNEAQQAISSELTWNGFEFIVCHLYFESLHQMLSGDRYTTERFYRVLSSLACDLIKSIPERLVVQSCQGEALYGRYCCWLAKTEIPAKKLKTEIMRCLQLFPASTKLLGLYVRIHAASHTIASLLAELKKHIFEHPRIGTLSLLPAIERLRSLNFASLPSLFERMFKQHKDCNHSPLIWILYLEFAAGLKGDDFKRVFLRAIRACPWSKELWMRGLELNKGRFTGSEIAGFIESMKEKGIRLRTDVLEILIEADEGNL